MNDSDDIANLFKQFGGQADQYREIGRSNDAKLSRERWPLLSSVEPTQATDAPPVQLKDGLAQAPVPLPGLSALRATPATPAARPASPEVRPNPVGSPRQEPALRSDPTPSPASRVEPSLAGPLAGLSRPAATPGPAPVPAVEAPAAKPGPTAEFIPPRPRPSTKFAHRTPSGTAPAPFARLVPEAPAPAPVFAPSPAPAYVPAPASTQAPAPAAPPAAPTGAQSDLQSIFKRLSQPAPAPDTPTLSDKNATLLQRLSRL